jgi:hypothetical protein
VTTTGIKKAGSPEFEVLPSFSLLGVVSVLLLLLVGVVLLLELLVSAGNTDND